MGRVYHDESRPGPAARWREAFAEWEILSGASLHAHDLDVDATGSWAVELREEDGLEPPERQLPAADAHGHASAEEGGAQMGMRVAALAVGEAGIVVAVAVVLRHQRLDHGLEVFDERALELVDEERAGRVQRVHEEDALLDVGTQHDVTNGLRDVEDLGPVLTQHRERLARDLEGLHRGLPRHPGRPVLRRPC